MDARRGAAPFDDRAHHARQCWHVVDRDLLAVVELAALLSQRLAARTLATQPLSARAALVRALLSLTLALDRFDSIGLSLAQASHLFLCHNRHPIAHL